MTWMYISNQEIDQSDFCFNEVETSSIPLSLVKSGVDSMNKKIEHSTVLNAMIVTHYRRYTLYLEQFLSNLGKIQNLENVNNHPT